MKGGVGKTTISAHLMRVLYLERKIRILLVDLDAQFNLSQTVLDENSYNTLLENGKSVISAFEPVPSTDFFDIRVTDKAPPSPDTLTKRLKQVNNDYYLDLIPGSFELVKYSLIDDSAKLASALKYFKRFISSAANMYDLVVIDCNPSSSFITQCAIGVSSHILSPVRPDKYSVIGVRLVSELLDRIATTGRPEQLVVMNGVGRGSPPDSVESSLRSSRFGGSVLVNRLPRSGLLAANPTYTGFATDKKVSWSAQLRDDMKKLSNELADRLGV